jgi:hypothetical protein
MDTPTQGASGYYVWADEGKSFEVHVSLDVIESLGVEIMRGFGAVPKRGAEVGGLLLGSIERGAETIVRIEDFEPVPCGYTRGPSYLLAPGEREVFNGAVEGLRPDAGPAGNNSNYAVGYFRSHTREGLALAPEDIELLDRCFAGPSYVALLVKPFATRASSAGFFFREGGMFQETTPLEFPFRRRELTGEEPPERRPLTDRGSRNRGERALVRSSREEPVEQRGAAEPAEAAGYAYATTLPTRSRLIGWMWFPLSFIFLLLGVALGYWAALGMSPRITVSGAPEYSLTLAAKKSGENVTVQWNGDSAVIRNADRGVLEVHDGGYAKTVDLDTAQLRGGKLAFQNASGAVTFRLTVYINSRVSLSETLDWRQ